MRSEEYKMKIAHCMSLKTLSQVSQSLALACRKPLSFSSLLSPLSYLEESLARACCQVGDPSLATSTIP